MSCFAFCSGTINGNPRFHQQGRVSHMMGLTETSGGQRRPAPARCGRVRATAKRNGGRSWACTASLDALSSDGARPVDRSAVARAIQRTVSERRLIGSEADKLERNVTKLTLFLPDLAREIHGIRSDDIVRLADRVHDIVGRLLELKKLFPEANVSCMVLRSVRLVDMEATDELQVIANHYREALPDLSSTALDRVFQSRPSLLDMQDHRYDAGADEECFFICRDVPELSEQDAYAILAAKGRVVEKMQPDITSLDRMVVRLGYGSDMYSRRC